MLILFYNYNSGENWEMVWDISKKDGSNVSLDEIERLMREFEEKYLVLWPENEFAKYLTRKGYIVKTQITNNTIEWIL